MALLHTGDKQVLLNANNLKMSTPYMYTTLLQRGQNQLINSWFMPYSKQHGQKLGSLLGKQLSADCQKTILLYI